jgi:hypothetical protein
MHAWSEASPRRVDIVEDLRRQPPSSPSLWDCNRPSTPAGRLSRLSQRCHGGPAFLILKGSTGPNRRYSPSKRQRDNAVHYSFSVADFHRLLLASLLAHRQSGLWPSCLSPNSCKSLLQTNQRSAIGTTRSRPSASTKPACSSGARCRWRSANNKTVGDARLRRPQGCVR